MTLRLVSRDYLPTSAAAGGPWRANYLPTLAGQQLNNKSKFHVWPLACGPASDHSLAGMVLLHLRSSQAEFDAYLFATEPGRRPPSQPQLCVAIRGATPRTLAAERRLKQLPTYLARPGGPKVELPTYLPLYYRYIELRSLRKDQTQQNKAKVAAL